MTSRGLHKVEQLLDQAGPAGLVLGIDTAGPAVVLGLVGQEVVLAAAKQTDQSHAASLPLMVEGLFKQAGAEFADLNGIAVGIGPGSFTGVRVGLSYGKGLAFAARCSLVGVSSLESMAVCALDCPRARAGTMVCAVINAGREQFYNALYRVNEGGLEQVSAAALADAARLTACLVGEVILVGDDLGPLEGRLRELAEGRATIAAFAVAERRAAALAAIGAARIATGHTDSLSALEPLYVRAGQAWSSQTPAT
jgi:tRNA threonylcarbamoyladenosine biosynthesis protein TsaB